MGDGPTVALILISSPAQFSRPLTKAHLTICYSLYLGCADFVKEPLFVRFKWNQSNPDIHRNPLSPLLSPIIQKGAATVICIDKAGQIDKIDSQLSTKTHGSEQVESFQFRD